MLLLLDIGNTHTHLGLANEQRVLRQLNIPTAGWFTGSAAALVRKFTGRRRLKGAAICSVVPRATPKAISQIKRIWSLECFVLNPQTIRGLGIDYPKPSTIGPDRLANAVAGRHQFGAPVVVVDFGTAVTFEVVDRRGNFVGGVIAPGVAVMTDYLHEKTALLPKIRIRQIHGPIGKSTEESMLIGAVYGCRGLVRELIRALKQAMKVRRLSVVATGRYGRLIAAGLPEICAVEPMLTLEGLRLVWQSHQSKSTLSP